MTLTGIVLAVLADGRDSGGLGVGGRIAVLSIDGVIMDDEEVLDHLRRFRRNRSVRGYLVHINSPGGAVAPSQSIFQELRRIRTEDELPVVAAIGSLGASGGYYVALAADSIFALPGSITGSIGVIMEIPDASELMGKVGVRMQTVMSAEHKDIGSPFRPLGEGDRAILESVVRDVYEQFVDHVALERQLDRSVVEPLADGRILSGRQALQRRLIDRLGNREDALSTAGVMAGLGSEPRTIRPPQPRVTLLDVLLGRGAAGALARLAGVAGLTSAGPPALDAAGPRIKYVVPW
jgi:protease IV